MEWWVRDYRGFPFLPVVLFVGTTSVLIAVSKMLCLLVCLPSMLGYCIFPTPSPPLLPPKPLLCIFFQQEELELSGVMPLKLAPTQLFFAVQADGIAGIHRHLKIIPDCALLLSPFYGSASLGEGGGEFASAVYVVTAPACKSFSFVGE